MRNQLIFLLVFCSAPAMAAPEARQAADPDQQAEPPLARCGVGAIEIQRPIGEIQRPIGRPRGGNLKAFPAAEKGMTRFVVELPKLEEEQHFKVEIIVGKTVEVDTANRHFFTGQIEAENIKGWGFTRYVVTKIGPLAGTLRARVGGAQKEERFVTLGGEPYLVRYNSRLPLVVYVPEGAEVKFRVWSAGERTHEMEMK